MNQQLHIKSLDGLRAIAALLVVATHGSQRLWPFIDCGTVGVAIFFSLSGFLMGLLYHGKAFNFSSVRKYLISRFARIAPAYIFVILLSYFIYGYVTNEFPYKIDDHNLLRHLLFAGNVSVFWSIPPEIQFYVFFIFIWYALTCFSQKKFLPFALLAVSIILMFLFKDKSPGTFLPSKAHFFIFGCFAGVLRTYNSSLLLGKRYLSVLQGVLLFSFVYYGIYLSEQIDGTYPYTLIHFALLASLIVFILSFETVFTKLFLSNSVMVLIGKVSFSLYLIHNAIIYIGLKLLPASLDIFVKAFVILFSCLLISFIMYKLIEIPLQKMVKRII